ncbi:AMP-binding protein [Desulfoglaeba alkanexedens]|uniref:Acetyl-CoA synthetase n=1 Tax=Desulfoglaeba alkanexedens ALDC TaxID=980445 RepID=A0A4V1ERW5_9BACT|nr:AMP-binding protein [Desulfoglaeba alkanexedens]QCQ23061.1 acetyl-CoA synthetase [Desulfoglaeba alkanexedens ALDC]
MTLQSYFKEIMNINRMEDNEQKAEASRSLFTKLNHAPMPDRFNWSEEIFEGIHVKERGGQAALLWVNIDTGEERRYTYSEFADKGNQLLNFLRKHGIRKGGSVYMMIPAFPEIWFGSFATIKGGMVSVPTAMTMTVRELEYRFKTFAPQAVLADKDSAPLIDEALNNVGATPKVKIIIGEREGWKSYNEVEKESKTAEAEKTKPGDITLCFFTSGTTGMAKRVAHTAVSYPVGHLSTANIIGIKPGDIHNNLSQPGWAKWAWSCLFAPLDVGATTAGFYYPARLDVEKYLGALDRYKVNTFCAPPTAWRAFILADLGKFKFEALRESVSAGEPLNPEIIHTWQRFTGTQIRDYYGQTESTGMIGNPPWNKGKIVPGSFGQPHFLYDIALVDDEGQEITKPDEVGHIAVRLDRWRAIGLFTEYMESPELMKGAFRGNYYYTGDRASFNDKGYWWFVGRADDVIKSSDYRVGPFEVESALLEHAAVAEAAVVGSPDPKRWQLVKAFVILKPGYEPSPDLACDIFKHCMKVLAKFKIPRIIEFVPEVPKTLSGKIRRVELRQNEITKKEKGERGQHEYFFQDFPQLKS